MATHARTPALVEQWRLGLLRSAALVSVVERHLAEGCETCEAAARRADALAEAIAASLSPVTPSAFARARLLRSVGCRRKPRRSG